MPSIYDLTVYRGDSWSQTFRLSDSTGTPIDLTGATVACWARDGNAAVVQLTTTIANQATSPGVVTVTPAAGGVPAGDYRYDLEVIKAGVTTTWLKGRLRVEGDITNAA